LGCDEVYELGKGKSLDLITKKGLKPSYIFLEHVRKVAGYVRRKYPQLQPLIWDDMLRKIDFGILAVRCDFFPLILCDASSKVQVYRVQFTC
jgi:hexosaminidase